MLERYESDVIVVGAGVVGIAVARALALSGRDVIVLERERHIAEHQSSRNSEVIHAGLYYPPGSLKARFCIEGKAALYAYCESRGVPHRRVGKLVVATSTAQVDRLEQIRANAAACGMTELELIDGSAARALEPALSADAALISPSSGLIDSHAFMLSLMAEAEAAGAMFVMRSPVERITPTASSGLDVLVGSDTGGALLSARTVVNCAGPYAPQLASSIDGYSADRIPEAGFARGCYFSLQGRAPFTRLIYPVPEPGGLGVHLTLDLAGQARFGPDVEWIDRVDYSIDSARSEKFYAEIRRYWAGLKDESLAPAYAGVRAKIGPRETAQDFRIDGPSEHGVEGLICLYGIESPGLTSSLVIADTVAACYAPK